MWKVKVQDPKMHNLWQGDSLICFTSCFCTYLLDSSCSATSSYTSWSSSIGLDDRGPREFFFRFKES